MALHVRGHSRHAKTTLNERLETVLTCWERLAQRHPNLPTNEILTRAGQKNYDHFARECIKRPPLKLKSDLTPLMNNSFPRIHQKIQLGLPLSMSRLPRRFQPTCLCYLFKALPTKLSFLSQMPTYKRPGVSPARRSAHCGLVGSDT